MKNIKALPKVSLHDHLDGALRPATIIELADKAGMMLPADNAQDLADWFVESCSQNDLSTYLQTFELTVSLMQDAKSLRRVAREYALDLAADGIIYGEVRWAPEQHLRAGLTMLEAVVAVQAGLDEAVKSVTKRGAPLVVGQILCAMRQNNNSLEVAQLALELRDEGVVGFDLAGPEKGFLPEMHEPALELLARNNFATTIHAGEEGSLESIESAVFNRALRLGHGTKLAEDLQLEDSNGDVLVTMGELAEWVRDRQIVVESCPSSNLQTGSSPWGPEIEDHPFDVFFKLGINVTVNTDNRLMSGTTLTAELALLADAFDYDLDDLVELQINAAMAAFAPLEERLELVDIINEWADR